MTVGELEELLARLPEDMTVVIDSGYRVGAFHVDHVHKGTKHHMLHAPNGMTIHVSPRRVVETCHDFPDTIYRMHRAQLTLRAWRSAPHWWEEPPTSIEISGRWPADRKRDR